MEDKLEEHGLLENAELNEMLPGKRFQLGPFTIHPIQVTHSIVDAVSIAVHTPLGVIIHTGDFKIDLTPTDNKMFDLHAFAEYGKRGRAGPAAGLDQRGARRLHPERACGASEV